MAKNATPKKDTPSAIVSSPEDRYVNRQFAAGSDKTESEIRKQYRDKMASGKSTVDPIKVIDKRNETARYVDRVKVGVPAATKAKAEPKAPKEKAARAPSAAPVSSGLAAAKPVTAKRQSAIDAYAKAYDRPPPPRMSAKAMTEAVALREYSKRMTSMRATALSMTFESSANSPSELGKVPKSVRVPSAMEAMARQAIAEHTKPTPVPTRGQKIINAYAKAQPAVAAYAAGMQMGHAYHAARAGGKSHSEAAGEAIKAGAVPASLAAAPLIEKGARAVSQDGYTIARTVARTMSSDMLAMDMLVGGRFATIPMVTGYGLGIAGRGVEIAAKAAGRIALPAVVGYSAYQGAKEDTNKLRGAMRGVVRGLDPTSLFMAQGLGERAYNAAFGVAAPNGVSGMSGRLSADQQQSFAKANAAYGSKAKSSKSAENADKKGRGFANAAVQKAAQEARGVKNVTPWAATDGTYPGGA